MKPEKKYAGIHILSDMWGIAQLQDYFFVERILQQAAESAGARIARSSFQEFSDTGGFTGFLLLFESHISIHTWPEKNFAALDIFMCGSCNAEECHRHILTTLNPASHSTLIHKRGIDDGKQIER